MRHIHWIAKAGLCCALLLSFLGCLGGGDDAGGSVARPVCDATAISGQCIQYIGTLDDFECTTFGGITTATSCDTSTSTYVGSCTTSVKTYYYYSTGTMTSYTLTSAASTCSGLGGTYGAPGGSGSYPSGDTVQGRCTGMPGLPDECIEFTDGGWDTALMQSNCSAFSGTFAASACSSTSRAGRCKVGDGTFAEHILHFYTPTWSSGTAQSSCTTQGGVFTSG